MAHDLSCTRLVILSFLGLIGCGNARILNLPADSKDANNQTGQPQVVILKPSPNTNTEPGGQLELEAEVPGYQKMSLPESSKARFNGENTGSRLILQRDIYFHLHSGISDKSMFRSLSRAC